MRQEREWVEGQYNHIDKPEDYKVHRALRMILSLLD